MAESKFVSERKLRQLFNDGEYLLKVQNGELTECIVKTNHPSPQLAFEPFCTRSQIVSYHDETGKKVAIVHQYLKPDGTTGASGLPDPKFLMHDGVLYKFRAKKPS